MRAHRLPVRRCSGVQSFVSDLNKYKIQGSDSMGFCFVFSAGGGTRAIEDGWDRLRTKSNKSLAPEQLFGPVLYKHLSYRLAQLFIVITVGER